MLAARRRRRQTRLIYPLAPIHEDWVLDEDKVPESRSHDQRAKHLEALLTRRFEQLGRKVAVGRNLAIRWDEAHPRIGVDPDVYVVEPPPPLSDDGDLYSLRLWIPGHEPPLLAVEIVSQSRAGKDYAASPEKYALLGAQELWVFDPKLVGPKAHGGPIRLQVWRRDEEDDSFTRIYVGEGPVWSEAAGGWLFVVDEGRSLRLADDEQGTKWWMTQEEAERAAKEQALRRIAELEALLAARG